MLWHVETICKLHVLMYEVGATQYWQRHHIIFMLMTAVQL